MDLVAQALSYSYFLFLHLFRMMYWVWIPGFVLSAFFSLRYRETARSRLLAGAGVFTAVLYGMATSPSQRTALRIAGELRQKGVGTERVIAYLVASQNLVIYFLVVLMALMGAEFALGQLMGGVLMIAIVVGGWHAFVIDRRTHPTIDRSDDFTPDREWRELLLSGAAWWEAVRYVGREFRFFWLNLAVGILLGGFILSIGLQKWWIDFSQIGGGGISSEIITAFAGLIIGMMLFIPPIGNLVIAANLFRVDAIGYPGVVSFILASTLNPLLLPGYRRLFGNRRTLRFVTLLFLAALASSLVVTWAYALFGLRPGHVPLGRELVDEIIRWLPFTMGTMGEDLNAILVAS